MRLHNLAPRPGAKHRRKRLGCGESSGHGKTSGRGHKGQKARSGGSIRLGFEGGQMPLIRRLPKRGFNNTDFKPVYAVVNLDTLEERFETGATINEAALRAIRLVHGRNDGIKLLARGVVMKSFTVEVDKSSVAAREKLEKAGGSLTLRPPKPVQVKGVKTVKAPKVSKAA
jgi:large subunit ribosomal protein L15